MPAEMAIGRRIQMYRLRRGLTQEVLAGRIGRSTSWLSQVERGLRGVDSWRVILDLAAVLECDPRDLVGQPLNLAPNGGVPFRQLDDLRSLLTDYGWLLAEVDTDRDRHADVSRLDAIGQQIAAANRLYQAAAYEDAARSVVQLVRQTEATGVAAALPDVDGRRLAALLAQGYHLVAKTLTKVDQADLAWVAAERAAAAASRSEDPGLIAASAYHLGHALRRAGRVTEATNLVDQAYGALDRRARRGNQEPAFIGLAGALTLTAVIAAASAGDRPAVVELLDRAAALADQLGQDRNDHWFAFGPTNVRIHRLAVAVEMGEAREAVRVGEQIDTSQLPAGLVGRRTSVLVDLARAYGQLRMDAAAVNLLLEAEQLAAQTVRYNKFVRELTRDLLRREHRASTPQLRPFARRMGLVD
jgi:transcriptional regulator with XRE-family HTH domain